MSYEVVARRWRPQTFDSVVGQRHVTSVLAAAIESDRVAHAFLFTGIRGVGKTTVARVLARALNCTDRKGAEPCNACPSCTQALAGASVDVIEIDGASNNGVEEVRALIEASQYRPATGQYRVYIIDEVHQLSKHAFNALLKTLEEPPSHVKFILATTEVHKVLETVLSRCQRYDFRRLTQKEIIDQLAHIIERDGLDVSSDALALIAREADGSMRDAQSLLEQLAASTGGRVDVAEAQLTLGVAPNEVITGIVAAVLRRDGAKVVELSREIRDAGHDPERVMNEVLELVRHVCVAAAAGPKALDGSIGDAFREAALSLKDERDGLDLHRIFNSLLQSAADLRHGAMTEVVFEMGLLKAAALESVLASSEILAMLEGASPPATAAGSGGGPRRAADVARSGQHSARNVGGPRRKGAEAASPAGSGARGASEAARAGADPSAGPAAGVPAADALAADAPHPAGAEAGGDLSDTAVTWKGFLEFVAGKGGLKLSVALENSELMLLEDKRVVIGAMTSVAKQQFESPSGVARAQELVVEHFGDGVKLEVVGGADASAGSGTGISSHSLEEDRRTRLERDALEDPLVQGAVEVLGGRVRNVSSIDD